MFFFFFNLYMKCFRHFFFSPESKWRCSNFKNKLFFFNTNLFQLMVLPTLLTRRPRPRRMHNIQPCFAAPCPPPRHGRVSFPCGSLNVRHPTGGDFPPPVCAFLQTCVRGQPSTYATYVSTRISWLIRIMPLSTSMLNCAISFGKRRAG